MQFIENESTELKRELNKDFIKEVVAFLNTRDGIIYIGVNDNGSIYGVSNTDSIMRKIRDIIHDQIGPSTDGLYEIGTLLVENKIIIFVKVLKGNKLYYIKKEGRSAKGCYHRDGTVSAQMSDDEIEKRFIQTLDLHKSIVNVEVLKNDYTFDILKIKLRSRGIEINENNFLQNFNLITTSGKFNILADLLADKNLRVIQVCTFNGVDKASYSKRNEFGNQSLIQAYEDVKHYCEALNDNYIDDREFPRKFKKMFNNEAFEEALLNAFVHNDWMSGNSPCVYIYSNRLEIMSYGNLIKDLSKEDFYNGVSIPVNPELMDIFLRCGLVDKSGHGVPKVIKYYGKEAYSFLGFGILVTIPFDKTGFKENEGETTKMMVKNDGETAEMMVKNEGETTKMMVKNDGETAEMTVKEELIDIIKKIILNNPHITQVELAKITNRSTSTIERTIKKSGDIKHVGSQRNGYWIIKE